MKNHELKIHKTKHMSFDLAICRLESFKDDQEFIESVNLGRYGGEWHLEISIWGSKLAGLERHSS